MMMWFVRQRWDIEGIQCIAMVDLFSSGIWGKGNMAATAATRGISSKKVKQ